MQKYLLTIDNQKEVFDSFDDALQVFQQTIYDYIHQPIENLFEKSALPSEMVYFLEYQIDHSRNSEVVKNIYKTLIDLFETFNICDFRKSKSLLNKLNIEDISYCKNNKKYDEKISVDLKKEKNEIIVALEADIVFKIHLITNAFIFDDKQKTYFYDSHQVCNLTTVKEDCGKSFDLYIKLEPINIEDSKIIPVC